MCVCVRVLVGGGLIFVLTQLKSHTHKHTHTKKLKSFVLSPQRHEEGNGFFFGFF